MNYISKLAKKAPRSGHGLYYDPLYGYIPVAQDLRQIIDSEVFQRLRGIKQLSTLYLVFSGANHTRFEHSIGVSYLAKLAHDRLVEYVNYNGHASLEPKDLNEVTSYTLQLVGLLHDIGHGPFAHVFEMYCRRSKKYNDWNHEVWGRMLITGMDRKGKPISDEFFKIIPNYLRKLKSHLMKKNPDYDEKVFELLDPDNIAEICFDGRPKLSSPDLTNKYYFLTDVLTSSYGVDRLDYLRRDALYTGVKTGEVDIWEIIRNLELHKSQTGRVELFLNVKASTSVEALLSSRNAVYRRIYHNPVSRSAQELVIRGLLELHEDPMELAKFTDNDLLEYFRKSNNNFVNEIEERLRYRILYELHSICSFFEITQSINVLERKKDDFYGEILIEERRISKELGMVGYQNIFFDMEKVPCIKKEDLQSKIFFDPHEEKGICLLDTNPHLKDLYVGSGTGLDKVETYKNQTSKIFVCFPLDFIEPSIVKLIDSDSDIEQGVNSIYNEKMKPMIHGFFKHILNLTDNQIKTKPDIKNILGRNERDIKAYLKSIIKIKSEQWLMN